jgi:hypothetical protein
MKKMNATRTVVMCFTTVLFACCVVKGDAQDNAMPVVQATQSASNDYDVIIKHGSIIDGTGNPWVSGDIGIRGDRIAAIGSSVTLVPSA